MKVRLLVLLFALSPNVWAKEISVMTYNVENLFDTVHDEGKEDYTYLPKALKDKSPEIQKYCKGLPKWSWRNSCFNLDWSKKALEAKMENLTQVITSFEQDGADILVVEEVENLRVLNILLKEKLAKYGYKYVSLIEGEDKRGIDNGVISKYPIVSSKLHKIDLSSHGKKTRGVFEAKIKVGKKSITIFANHWPSQGTKDPAVREKAAHVLVKAAAKARGDMIIAVGDFNVVPKNDGDLLERIVEPHFLNAEKVARNLGVDVFAGTHWFAGHWGSLDKMFVYKKSGNSKNTRALYEDFYIVKRDFMLGSIDWTYRDTGETITYDGVPKRFNIKTLEGYSDHLPVTMRFNL